MIKTILSLFLLQNTYRANGLIFYLKKIPFLGSVIPYSLYTSQIFKKIILVLNSIFEISKLFIFKFLYIAVILFGATTISDISVVKLSNVDIVFNILMFSTFAGLFINSFVLEPLKELNYALIFLKMDAKKVVHAGIIQFLVTTLIAYTAVFIFFPSLHDLGLSKILSFFVILISGKLTGAALKIYIRSKQKKYKMSHSFIESAIGILFLGLSVGYSVLNLSFSDIFMLSTAIFFFITGIFSLFYLKSFSQFLRLYKELFTEYESALENNSKSKAPPKNTTEKYIDTLESIDSTKTGYAFLSESFMKRHRKLLSKSTKIVILIEICIVILCVISCAIFPDFKELLNGNLIHILPTAAYLLYFINCGERVVRILFTNCDNEMLTYRFYRKPRAILSMFTLRLKALVLMDIVQSLPIALGLPTILYFSGGTSDFNEYIILFVSIIALSVFFSVHNLVIYYVFQPFNKELEMKNPIYTIIKTATYIVFFLSMQLRAEAMIFGIAVSIFSIIYIIISIPIAYKIAPDTFKLHE